MAETEKKMVQVAPDESEARSPDGSEPSAAHTPGPWRFIDATTEAGMQFAPRCVIKAGDKHVASFSWNDCSPWFPSKEESQANAHLIAAAPDLLSAAVAHLAARDALKDAPLTSLSKDDPRFAAVDQTLDALRAAISRATNTEGK